MKRGNRLFFEAEMFYSYDLTLILTWNQNVFIALKSRQTSFT